MLSEVTLRSAQDGTGCMCPRRDASRLGHNHQPVIMVIMVIMVTCDIYSRNKSIL